MSLEETKQLLQNHHISPNKLMGQNFMIEPSIFTKLSSYASLNNGDVVLDAGAGFGWLTCFLASKSKEVVAVEKDPRVAAVLHEQTDGLRNVTVIEGDVLKVAMPEFNKVIAAPPYYLSSQFVAWLLMRNINCAILILQKEFADRLVAAVGTEEYGWLTVVTNQIAEVELLDTIPKDFFYPQPEVDSVIVALKPWRIRPFEIEDPVLFVKLVKWLFTQRNKKLAKAISPFIRRNLKRPKHESDKIAFSLPHSERRVRQLHPKEFGAVVNALPK